MFQTHPLTVFKKHELLCRWSKREALVEKSEFNDEGALSLSVCAHWCRETFFIFFSSFFYFFFLRNAPFCMERGWTNYIVHRSRYFIRVYFTDENKVSDGEEGDEITDSQSVTRLGDDRFLLT